MAPKGVALRPNNNMPQSQTRKADWLSFGAEIQKALLSNACKRTSWCKNSAITMYGNQHAEGAFIMTT
jgi:hypothetical protein